VPGEKSKWRPGSTIVFASFAPLAPPFRGDSVRLRYLIRSFRDWGWRTAVVHAHRPENDVTGYLEGAGLVDDLTVHFRHHQRPRRGDPFSSWCPPGYPELVAATCDRLGADVLYVQLSLLAPCLAAAPPGTLKVIDADTLFFEFPEMFRQAGLEFDWAHVPKQDEVAAVSQADLVLTVNDREHQVLRAALPDRDHALVQPYRDVRPAPQWLSRNILTIGNYFDANSIGLQRFVKQALPEIQAAFPDATLTIIGSMGNDVEPIPGVELVGSVRDVDPYFHRCSIFLNPVLAGGGFHAKTIDALSRGKCLVSTPAGLDGLQRFPGTAVSAGPDDFAPAIIELLRDPERIREQGERALRFAESYFAPEAAETKLKDALGRLLPAPGTALA
jgi:glycosyltransferase involved in cell wall biosynthesis